MGAGTRGVLIAALAVAMSVGAAYAGPAYHLTFDDEFVKLSIANTGEARFGQTGSPRSGRYETFLRDWPFRHLGTGEVQEYVDLDELGLPQPAGKPIGYQPFTTAGGILGITATKAPPEMVPFLQKQTVLSGLLSTHSSFRQTYGYFECRAKLPRGAGLWPAIWLLPTTPVATDPTSLAWKYEIDVLEAFGARVNTGGGANQVHWAVHDNVEKGGSQGDWVTVPGSIYDAFHVYGVKWDPRPGSIRFYVDGAEIAHCPTPAGMDQPMFLIVCLAVGGTWAGPVDESALPARMEIDYLRAYSNDPTAPAVLPEPGYRPGPKLPIPLDRSKRQ